ncbi:MAG: phosphoenolpyruvate synthase, partial [SAR202 cluster bacterium]|nr:phosphoenolpyruvate synthase [SAR202 cluster bacterium]
AGGKAANLGEMINAGIPVPDGYVVATSAYRAFMIEHGLDDMARELLTGVDIQNSAELAKVASEIRARIVSRNLPHDLTSSILRKYFSLEKGPVAVRSSATAEDMDNASFAGQQDTYLNVEGAMELIRAVRDCWASLFEARAIFYRDEQGIDHSDVDIAVVIQQMVPSDVSGVMFTVDPAGNEDEILIEAILGLGEPLVSGNLSPDAYSVNRHELKISSRELATQPWMLTRNASHTGSHKLLIPRSRQGMQKLNDAHVIALAELGLRLEKHYGQPQDVEWAFVGDRLNVLQSRPITTNSTVEESPNEVLEALDALVTGASASPGVVAGPVRIIDDATQVDQVQKGDILVTEMTTPDFVPAMKRAAAIVTDRGGRTCHAAIVSREMGLPCVVGAGDATTALLEIPIATVDGGAGAVYEGDHQTKLTPEVTETPIDINLTTKTKLYVNLADPDAAQRVASMGVDGVGLLRAEFMIAHLGEHPRSMLESGRGEEYTRHLAHELDRFAEAFSPRPIVYRFSDFKTNEYRNLKGGESFEPFEENPMIGYRGCARYIAEPEIFALEVEALKRVRETHSNVGAMVPFVRTVTELEGVISLLREQGLERGPDFKLWMMAELPTNFLLLDRFLDTGIDGVSIGSNDLTQLVLGVDRDNEQLAEMFDERDPAVLQAIEHVVKTCVARGATVSICGQGPSVYPELSRKLVEWGITSVSVTPDMIQQTRQILHDAEIANAA